MTQEKRLKVEFVKSSLRVSIVQLSKSQSGSLQKYRVKEKKNEILIINKSKNIKMNTTMQGTSCLERL